ncbi:TVP38/TMEM64 family protein [Neobacillus sp. PS3-12]|uniref:TVP38/TMEM64 family protein n=1 Tax=Neobacillus sp. PS3-12 TaxID=3070677 RepID=UPI0027E1ECDE|nr:TVP38/TMEM64 family protein [Neobacillus sp. PS3-12]WML52699.1 TVP38/TMEM64 family protein [Neobacillus sp. PS3-12]
MKKIISILFVISIILFGYTQKDILIELVKQDGPYAVLISMLMVTICVFFPVVPFTVLGGMIGALFGATEGLFISYTGAMIGTLLFFFISRYGFRDWAQSTLQKYPKVMEYQEILNRNSFIAILVARLIPIIPAPVFNAACGLSKVDWKIFFLASAIGKIPNIFIVSFAGANIIHNKWFSISLYGSYLLIISMAACFIVSKRMPKVLPEKNTK